MRTKCNRMDLIKHLNLWGNDLQNISVIRQMPNLEVLSLSVNRVGSLNDLRSCPKLTELYLRKNNIRDLAEVRYLVNLRHLRVLWLNDNPCASLPYYRMYILQHLPHLGKLDAEEVSADERRQAQQADLADFPTSADAESEESPQEEDYPGLEAPDEPQGWAESLRTYSRGAADNTPSSRPSQHGDRRSFAIPNETLSAQEVDGFGERRDSQASRGSRQSTGSYSQHEFSPSGGSRGFGTPAAAASRRGERAYHEAGVAGCAGGLAREDDVALEASPQSDGGRRARQGCGQHHPGYGDEYDRHEQMLERTPQAWQCPESPPRPARRSGGEELREARGCFGSEAGARSEVRRSRGNGAGGNGAPSGGAGATARADNVLCAVLALVKELDDQGLELVRRAVEQRLCEG